MLERNNIKKKDNLLLKGKKASRTIKIGRDRDLI